MTGIFGCSNAEGKLCKQSAIPQDCSGGTYAVPGVPKMMPAHCFPLALEAIKWPSEIHQSSEKCIYFQTRLFVPSLKVPFLKRY